MFQFSGLASHAYLIQHAIIQGPWDQCLFDNSPKLFAAYHALHRLLSPRHPPHALCNLTTMICGSLSRTETLQPPSNRSIAAVANAISRLRCCRIVKYQRKATCRRHTWAPRRANLRDGESKRRQHDRQATGNCFLRTGQSLGVNSGSPR